MRIFLHPNKKLIILSFLIGACSLWICYNSAQALTISGQNGAPSACPSNTSSSGCNCPAYINSIAVNGLLDINSNDHSAVPYGLLKWTNPLTISWNYYMSSSNVPNPNAFYINVGCGNDIGLSNDSSSVGNGITSGTKISSTVDSTLYKYCKFWVYGKRLPEVLPSYTETVCNTSFYCRSDCETLGVSNTRPFEMHPTLTVTKNGTGSGTITGTGINCGSDCSEMYTSGGSMIVGEPTVTLTATASTGSVLSGWSCTKTNPNGSTTNCNSNCSGTTCAVKMDRDVDITATFNTSCTNIGLSTPIINPGSPLVNTNFTISCPTAKTGLSNVFANANTNSNPCSFTGWSGNTALFSCTGMVLGHYEAKCYITAVNGYCADSITGGYTVIATPTSDTSCSRCSNDNNHPCKNASWTNIGSCNIYSLKPGTTVSYTTNDSCGGCPSGQACSSGACIPATSETSCSRCSNNNPCQYASWTNIGPCDTYNLKPGTTVSYTTNDICSSLCPSGQACSSGKCIPSVSHNECNTSHQCIYVSGSGINQCLINSDCGTPKCGIDVNGNLFCGASGTGTSCASPSNCGSCQKR